MPSDEYASVGGAGALRLKGAKVKKHKKKKDKGTDLGKALSTGGEGPSPAEDVSLVKLTDDDDDKPSKSRKGKDAQDSEEEDDAPVARKTEAEKRFEEAKRKKLLEMSESAGARPELLKTHKQRVEELNTYLSKLSEHHDMPKIGPG